MLKLYPCTILLATSLLAGCSVFHPYTPPVQQGKEITAKMIDNLKPGMTESQVEYILGSPDVHSPFKQNVWAYVYTYQDNLFANREEKQLILTFKDGKLSTLSGDYPPPQVIRNTEPLSPQSKKSAEKSQIKAKTNHKKASNQAESKPDTSK